MSAVSLKNPIMLRNLSGEKLDEVHGSGYYDYLDDPEYTENVTRAVARMVKDRLKNDFTSVIDVGCGAGALAGMLPTWMRYLGLDASTEAIARAEKRNNQMSRVFTVARIEDFCETVPHMGMFDIIHFGCILCCLIRPEFRIPFVQRYVEKFKARFIIVSDLEGFDFKPLRERFTMLDSETFHLDLPEQPVAKRHRCVEIYATRVECDG